MRRRSASASGVSVLQIIVQPSIVRAQLAGRGEHLVVERADLVLIDQRRSQTCSKFNRAFGG